MTIGQRIAEIRQKKQLSQYMLAKKAKVAYSTLHMIESGKRSGSGLTLATALRLAAALDVTLDILTAGTDELDDEEEAPECLLASANSH